MTYSQIENYDDHRLEQVVGDERRVESVVVSEVLSDVNCEISLLLQGLYRWRQIRFGDGV